MTNLQQLIDSKQYYAAAWKAIDSEGLAPEDAAIMVSSIVGKAIKHECRSELSRIMRTFAKYVDDDMSAAAHTCLNETTEIDLYPDEL